jgi:hypothetical protein
MELDQNENRNTMNSATPEAAPKTGEAKTEEQAQGTAEQGNTQQANAAAQGTASQQGNTSWQQNTSPQGSTAQQGPSGTYHSAYEHYQTQEHPHPEHGGPGVPPMDDLHRELRHYRRMATTELVVIAVLAGLSAGLVTYTVTNRKSQDVIASQQETIRGMQEDQKDKGDESDGGSGSGSDNSGSGAQMIPFFGGQEPGSGSDSGSESGSGSGTEEEDPSSIETTVQLGIYCTGVTSDVSEAYDIPSGVVVADFSEENSNAEKAGLQKGDVITKIDDTEVTSVTELKKALQNYNPGDKVTLTIERRSGSDYEEKTISFALEAKEDASDEATK